LFEGIQSYSETTLNAALAANQEVILYFHADWCPSCQAFDDDLAENPGDLPEDVLILKIDYDTETELKAEYDITQQHTFVFLDQQGEVMGTNQSAVTVDALIDAHQSAAM
jgi:thiol-disulfide isomerase/thioredoxin